MESTRRRFAAAGGFQHHQQQKEGSKPQIDPKVMVKILHWNFISRFYLTEKKKTNFGEDFTSKNRGTLPTLAIDNREAEIAPLQLTNTFFGSIDRRLMWEFEENRWNCWGERMGFFGMNERRRWTGYLQRKMALSGAKILQSNYEFREVIFREAISSAKLNSPVDKRSLCDRNL